MVSIVLTQLVLVWVSSLAVAAQGTRQRELGRFRTEEKRPETNAEQRFNRFLESLGRIASRGHEKSRSSSNEGEMTSKLRAAGLETFADQGKFMLVKYACYSLWPVLVVFALANFSTYYAVVTSLFGAALLFLMPHLWLKSKTVNRKEDVTRELPLVIDLTNLGTSAGWDISVSLERVIDCLIVEFPVHPLIKELRRARYLASSGYTWKEVLERVGEKLEDDTVSRVTRSLVQAMEQGGDRSAQLSGIAQDAQRSYYSTLDKRLAALPVKALIITMVLFLTYFTYYLLRQRLELARVFRVF